MDENIKEVEASDHVRLPIGYEVDGVRYRDVIIDELTGIDDHLVVSKKVGKNTAKATSLVLCRTIQEIVGAVPMKKNPESLLSNHIVQQMYGPDRDYLLSRVYMLSGRDQIMLAGECPRCGRIYEEQTRIVDLDVVEWDEDAPCELDFELEVGLLEMKGDQRVYHKNGTLVFPRGKIQELSGEIDNPIEAIDSLMCSCIKQIGTLSSVSKDQVKRLKSRDRESIMATIQNEFPGLHPWKEVKCDCGRHYDVRADLSAFFGGRRKKGKDS
jgi:hypothetical protein